MTAYGSAARLAVYMRDEKLSYAQLSVMVTPVVNKRAIWQWLHQISVPSDEHRRQLDDLTRGFVPEGGWAPPVNQLEHARALLEYDESIRVEITTEVAVRVIERDERVRREVKPVPKALRRRWTRWLQQRLAV